MTRVECRRCAVRYAPGLTQGSCPVCGVTAPGHRDRGRQWPEADERRVVLVVAATIANVVLLAALAVLALH